MKAVRRRYGLVVEIPDFFAFKLHKLDGQDAHPTGVSKICSCKLEGLLAY